MMNQIFTGYQDGILYYLANETIFVKIGNISYKVGKIRVHEKGYIFQKYEREIHRKTNSFSIPYFIIDRCYGIEVFYEGDVYKITTSKAKKCGQILYFKNKIEKKIYINLQFFYKINTNENEKRNEKSAN